VVRSLKHSRHLAVPQRLWSSGPLCYLRVSLNVGASDFKRIPRRLSFPPIIVSLLKFHEFEGLHLLLQPLDVLSLPLSVLISLPLSLIPLRDCLLQVELKFGHLLLESGLHMLQLRLPLLSQLVGGFQRLEGESTPRRGVNMCNANLRQILRNLKTKS